MKGKPMLKLNPSTVTVSQPVRALSAGRRERLRVAALAKLHLALDGRSLCGRAIDELDAYSDETGLRAWNDGPLERCGRCSATLLARIRPPALTAAPAPEDADGAINPARSRGRAKLALSAPRSNANERRYR
jgi:hypothetical protein